MKTKNINKRLFLITLACVIIITSTVFATEINTEGKIAVNGSYSVSIEPDYAKLSIGVVSNKTTVKLSQEDCNKKMNALIEDLKNNNIDEKDIRTSSYDISPVYDYENSSYSTSRIESYDVSYNIEITLHDINSIGKIIDICVNNGANNSYGIEFLSTKAEDAYKQALSGALKNATEKASLIAKDSGTSIVGILLVNENGGYNNYMQGMYKSYDMSVERDSSTNISAGNLSITASVQMEFSIK